MAVFKSIAFQAEISRYEIPDPDFVEIARRNCNEEPSTRSKAISDFRKLIQERGEIVPRRNDDAYLLRFLRCRRFIPQLAHRLLVRYETFRRENSFLYACAAFQLDKVKNVYGGMLPDSPVNGRVTFMRFGRWEPNEVPIIDVVRCALIMDELAVIQPKLQVLGVTIVVDLQGLGMRHVRHLTPTIAYQIVSLMGVSFPLFNHSLHVINYSWFLHSFFYVFKQFIPRAAWDRLYFHGCDLSSLHKFIHPQYLPPEYGGTGGEIVTTEEWLREINRYKDDFLVKELRDLGFTVDD